MKKSSFAYFRQLCCLGLGGQAVMPSLLGAAHEIIESETNAFFWADEAGHLAGFVPEYFIPEVVDSLLGEFDQLVDRVVPIDFATTMRRGQPVGNLLPMFDDRSIVELFTTSSTGRTNCTMFSTEWSALRRGDSAWARSLSVDRLGIRISVSLSAALSNACCHTSPMPCSRNR